MTYIRLSLPIAALALASVAACAAPSATPIPSTQAAAPSSPAPSTPAAATAPQSGTIAGEVAETMNSGGYTYVRLATGNEDVWLASSEFQTRVGERLTVALDMPMANFHSRTLNRDFALIYFVSGIAREAEPLPAPANAAGAPAMAGSHASEEPAASPEAVEPVAPAPGGLAIADVWARRASLSGKVVVVRGKVVKANNAIMGRNWFHLQDGSGAGTDGTNDLTVTTAAMVNVGDIVTVSGTLVTDKDFGAGYMYEALVENATVTVK